MSDVIERLIRYCKVPTPSNPDNEAQVPSNPEEHDLARLLADELQGLGVTDAVADEHAYVIAHVPASAGCEGLPCLGLIAHIDASPDAPAHGINPQVHTYEGGELVLGTVDGERSPSPPRIRRRSPRSSARSCSRATAPRCSPSTTRPAWPRSWRWSLASRPTRACRIPL